MVNICITSENNLNLPYIYDQNYIPKEKFNINESDNLLERILSQLNKGSKYGYQIAINGGEPTLSPDLYDIATQLMYFCEEKTLLKPTIITNGIELEQFLPYFQNTLNYIINLHDIKFLKENDKLKLENTLEKMNSLNLLTPIVNESSIFSDINKQFKFKLNLTTDYQNFDYFINLLKEYKQNSFLCHCAIKQNELNDKITYYKRMKPKFLELIDICQSQEIKIELFCNKISNCYFTENEINKIQNNCVNRNYWCGNQFFISMNGNVYNCYNSSYKKHNLFEDFINSDILFNRTMKFELYDNIKQFNTDLDCSRCTDFKLFYCQGGCAMFNKENEINGD